MVKELVTGEILKNAFISGANNIKKYKQAIDELNIFPVPDGDTGTNMNMTISMAAKEVSFADDNLGVDAISKIFADALLRNARGNSGVILSLIFRGFAKSFVGKNVATTLDMALALKSGVQSAYDVVMKPTEGTMLTVIRKSAEYAVEVAEEVDNIDEFWEKVCIIAKETLELTPTMLPVLEKAGVVDAGGKGLLVIFEGMQSVFKYNKIINKDCNEDEIAVNTQLNDVEEEEIKFSYCTEFIICKSNKALEVTSLRAYLESVGDCVVVVDDEDIIKIHIHTNEPGEVITRAIKYGQLTNIKIDNMKKQCEGKNKPEEAEGNKKLKYIPVDENLEYGFVAVVAGDGLCKLFKDLGVNSIVSGGQTMNPSTDDILNAIHATPAKTVFVLPNNKNIIMAAEQAVNMADRKVCVLQSRTIPQGLAAMLAFAMNNSFEENRMEMTKAIDNVSTGQITFAAKDSDFDGHKIKRGDILGLANGKLCFTDKDLNKACLKLIKNMLKKDSSFVTVIYGRDVKDEQISELDEIIKSKIGNNVEVNIIYGGQPVYYYIISVE